MQAKLVELESVRGVAALLVFLSHVPDWYSPFHDIIFVRNGGLMVELFFVLSGFVIYSAYGASIVTFRDVVRFQFLRFGRIYPVHLTFLLLFVGFELLKLLFINNPTSPPFAEGVSGPREFLENLTLIQALGFSLKPDSFNSPSWSISTEFYTYLIFAFLALFFANRQALVHGILVIALGTALVIPPVFLGSFTRLMICIVGFSSGCLVAIAAIEMQKRHIILHSAFGFLAILALAAFVAGELRGSGLDLLATFLVAGLLILSLTCGADGLLRRLLRSQPLVVLGKFSYSIYMSHWAVIYMADAILKRSGVVSKDSLKGGGGLEPTLFCIVFLTICLIVALLSWVSFRLVEAPFRSASRELAFQKLV